MEMNYDTCVTWPAVNPNGSPYPQHLQHAPNWDCLCHWHKVAAMKCEREGGSQVRTWWQPLIHLNAILNLNESLWLFICIVREAAAASVVFCSVLLVPAAIWVRGEGVCCAGSEVLSNSCCWNTFFCVPGPKYVSAAASDEFSCGSIS